MSSEPHTATTAQLKADIDSGRTRDKVAAGDPGLSPLGTDDEAAGVPPAPGLVAAVRADELSRAQDTAEPQRRPFNATWLLLIVALVAVLLAGIVYLRL